MATISESICEGVLYKAKHNKLFGTTWKKQWFRLVFDMEKLIQYNCEDAPDEGMMPRSSLNLRNCIVKNAEDPNNPAAFNVTDVTREKVWTLFSPEGERDAAIWVGSLHRCCLQPDESLYETYEATHHEKHFQDVMPDIHRSSESSKKGSSKTRSGHHKVRKKDARVKERVMVDEEEMIVSPAETVEYFLRSLGDETNFIQLSNLVDLVHTLDPNIDSHRVAHIMNQNLNPTNFDRIYVQDFLKWWNSFKERSTTKRAPVSSRMRAFESFCKDESEWGKSAEKLRIILEEPLDSESLFKEAYFPHNLPTSSTVHFMGSVNRDVMVDSITLASAILPQLDSVLHSHEYEKDKDEGWNECYQRYMDELLQVSKEYSLEDGRDLTQSYFEEMLQIHFSLFAVKGAFQKRALETVRSIVEEFPLPEAIRSIKKNEDFEDSDETIYEKRGMILRLINKFPQKVSLSSIATSGKAISKVDVGVNAIQRALCGHEFSSGEWLERVSWTEEAILKDRPLEVVRIPLSTVVDYAGFRFQVIAKDFDVSEKLTLVHGKSHSEGIFVNTDSTVNFMIQTIADRLGLYSVPQLIPGRNLPCSVLGDSSGAVRYLFCNTLAKDLQFHKCEDRLYALNTTHLRPSGLARRGTFDAFIRVLRPELVNSLQKDKNIFLSSLSISGVDSLSIDIAQSFIGHEASLYDIGTQSAQLNMVKNRTIAIRSNTEEEKKKLSDALTAEAVNPSAILYSKVIPETAEMLNQMLVCPVDSYTLVSFLHQRGLNVHCLGALYNFCKPPHIKQLLLCEMVARAGKVFLNSMLVDLLHHASKQSIAAEARGRSTSKNFYDHQSSVLDRISTTIVDFFNSMLGYQGPESTDTANTLWCDILPRIIFQKFSLDSIRLNQKSITHLPQLFYALQYNSNTIFEDRSDYAFGVSIAPLRIENFVDFVESSKGVEPNFLGVVGKVGEYAESLMGLGLFKEAISILRMRLSAVSLANSSSHSLKVDAARKDYCYKITVCKYLDGDYAGVIKSVESVISDDVTITAVGGNLLAMCMCAYFQLGNINEAMKAFEVIQLFHEYILILHLTCNM